MKFQKEFYLQSDVVKIAKKLLGKYLYTYFDDQLAGGIIAETEAYAGATDMASHAYNNRRTKRTEIMYHEGGVAYVYLCYGMYHMFNVITNVEGIPHAVLIRSILPTEGIDIILKRLNTQNIKKSVISGPGRVSKALGIETKHNGISLLDNQIWIEDKGLKIPENQITATTRIGVDYAGEDAKLLYRFLVRTEALL